MLNEGRLFNTGNLAEDNQCSIGPSNLSITEQYSPIQREDWACFSSTHLPILLFITLTATYTIHYYSNTLQ